MAAKKKTNMKKAFNAMKKMDPKSVVREGEMEMAGGGRAKKAFGAMKKMDPKSVVREGEYYTKKKRKK